MAELGPRTYDPDKHCGAKNKTGNAGGKCVLAKGYGTDHLGYGNCMFHGGNTPSGKKAGRKAQVEALASQYLDDPNAKPLADAGDALLRLASRVESAVDAVGGRVNQLTGVRYTADGPGTEQIRGEVQIWLQLIARLESLLKGIGQLDLDSRRLEVTKSQGVMFANAIQQILAALHLSEEQAALVPTVVPGVLRSIRPADEEPTIEGEPA